MKTVARKLNHTLDIGEALYQGNVTTIDDPVDLRVQPGFKQVNGG
jgi:hypothetical protein